MAVSNVKRVPMGPGAYRLYADYAHTVGAASETLKVEGTPVSVKLTSLDSSGNVAAESSDITTSTSGAITTITFLNTAAITSGKVVIDVQTSR